MFPSTSNIIGNNFLYSDNSNSFDSTNPYNSSSFPIHSPYIFYEDLHEHLHDFLQYQQQQQQQQQTVLPSVAHQEIISSTVITKMDQNHTHDIHEHASIMNGFVQGSPTVTDDVVFCSSKKQIPRKRTSNRDRHSKINTAHGPRDRRMRLSLDVAQKFFGLQDMLGFDKASKTVQWLLTKSKTAIKKLSSSSTVTTTTTTTTTKGGVNVQNTTSSSSTSNNSSECEVLSGIIDELSAASFSLPRMGKAKPAAAAREKKATPPGRAAGSRAFRPIAKEAREKARARARERTEEKRSIRLGNVNVNYYDHHQSKKLPIIVGIDQSLNRKSASWVPFEAAGEEESSTQIQIGKEQHPPFLQADHQEPTSTTTRTTASILQHELQDISVNGGHSNLFTTEGNWNPSPAFNYHHNAAISHEDSFTEAEYFGKPWG